MKKLKAIFKILRNLYNRTFYPGDKHLRLLGGKVGNNCRILTSSFGSEPWLIEIGDNVTITSGVKILTHDGATWLIRDDKGRRYSYKKVKIGNNVFIGVNSIIMPGVVVENNVIIAAGSVVTKSIPKGKIVGGNPAKIIGDYSSYEEKALNSFVSEEEMNYSLDYKNRINQVVEKISKPYYTRNFD